MSLALSMPWNFFSQTFEEELKETLHPDTLTAIEQILLFPQLSEQELSDFAHRVTWAS